MITLPSNSFFLKNKINTSCNDFERALEKKLDNSHLSSKSLKKLELIARYEFGFKNGESAFIIKNAKKIADDSEPIDRVKIIKLLDTLRGLEFKHIGKPLLKEINKFEVRAAYLTCLYEPAEPRSRNEALNGNIEKETINADVHEHYEVPYEQNRNNGFFTLNGHYKCSEKEELNSNIGKEAIYENIHHYDTVPYEQNRNNGFFTLNGHHKCSEKEKLNSNIGKEAIYEDVHHYDTVPYEQQNRDKTSFSVKIENKYSGKSLVPSEGSKIDRPKLLDLKKYKENALNALQAKGFDIINRTSFRSVK